MGIILLVGASAQIKGESGLESSKYRIVTDHERSISRLTASDFLNAAIVATDTFAGGGSREC